MTEEDAKTKWCPMYRVGFNPELQHNRISDGKSGNCIAADCMCWKWHEWKLDKNQRVTDKGVSGHCGLTKIIY